MGNINVHGAGGVASINGATGPIEFSGRNLLYKTYSAGDYEKAPTDKYASGFNWLYGYQNDVQLNRYDAATDSAHYIIAENAFYGSGFTTAAIHDVQFNIGDVYTFSFDIKGTFADGRPYGKMIYRDISGDAWAHKEYPIIGEISSTEFKRFYYTFIIPEDFDVSSQRICCNICKFTQNQSMDFFIKRLKLERGNFATEWTPAPEDIFTRLEALEAKVGITSEPPVVEGPEIMDEPVDEPEREEMDM